MVIIWQGYNCLKALYSWIFVHNTAYWCKPERTYSGTGSNHGKRISPHHPFVNLHHFPWGAWPVLQLLPWSLGRWAWPRKSEWAMAGAVLSGHALNDDCDALATSNASRPNAVFSASAPTEESSG